jgi:uncharacterized protein YecA (UPF0149 family)
MKKITEINKQFNHELWKNLKYLALTMECLDITQLFFKSGIEVDRSMLKDEAFKEQKYSEGDNAEEFLKKIQPQYRYQTFGDMMVSLNPKIETSLYSIAVENTMVKIYDVFQKFLNDISIDLMQANPTLYYSSEDSKMILLMGSIKENQDINYIFTEYRTSKLQDLDISSKLSFLEKGLDTKIEVSEAEISKLVYWEQAVRVVLNNQSVIDQQMLSITQNQNSSNVLKIGSKVSVSLEDIFDVAKIILEIGNEVCLKATGEQPTPIICDETPSKNIEKKLGRNEPCPCGSGKKYKHCCII